MPALFHADAKFLGQLVAFQIRGMFKIERRNLDGLLAKPFERLVTICSADHLEASDSITARGCPLQTSAVECELFSRGIDLLDHTPLGHRLRRRSRDGTKRKCRADRQCRDRLF